jgi:hypothetical protein
MTRRTEYRLLLITALLHLFADAAFAGGAILCVGSNDHVAIEAQNAFSGDCQTAEQSSEVGFTDAQSGAEGCNDIPLHADAELVSTSNEASEFSPNLIAVLGNPFESDLTRMRAGYLRQRGAQLPPDLRAHRTTVLLL